LPIDLRALYMLAAPDTPAGVDAASNLCAAVSAN
jgi:hypothetical protein